MIKRLASCPYCRKGEVALDCDTMGLIMNPDGVSQEPCEHLVGVSGFCCNNELLPDGTRRVGFTRLCWQCPGLDAVAPDDLCRRLREEAAVGREGGCRVTAIELKVGQYLSQAETIRWLDTVGWEKAEGDLPFGECSVEGWVGFAHHPAKLVPVLAGAESGR